MGELLVYQRVTFLHLKMDAWNTIYVSFWVILAQFSGAKWLLVLGRVLFKSATTYIKPGTTESIKHCCIADSCKWEHPGTTPGHFTLFLT